MIFVIVRAAARTCILVGCAVSAATGQTPGTAAARTVIVRMID